MDFLQDVGTDILSRLQLGDEKAFRVIYDLFSSRLYNFAYKFLKDEEKSEEIVQETLLKLWINRQSIHTNTPIGPYLFTIARRIALNMLRHSMNAQQVHNELKIKISETHNETEEHILYNDLALFTESILVNLPEKQQKVFRLSRNGGLSHKQIAEHLKLSENTVRNHVTAALKKIQLNFDKYYVSLLILLFLHR